jgi:hypothetical protein
MKTRRIVALTAFLLIIQSALLSSSSQAKGWRGIVPLQSTRADVERLLGPAVGQYKDSYYLEDVNVFFAYSDGDCKNGGSLGWKVPPNTVIHFTVIPKPNPQLSDLKIDEKKFKKRRDSEVQGFLYYTNEEDGLMMAVYDGVITSISYFPSAKDKHLRCPGSK